MNVEYMQKVRDAIAESNGVGTAFAMDKWFDGEGSFGSCGTVACIAGFAVGLDEDSGPMYSSPSSYTFIAMHAKTLLGLTNADADFLFFGAWSQRGGFEKIRLITKEETVEYLDRCIEAGAIVR